MSMNKVILRFYIVRSKKVFEVIFDGRLTLLENFYLLKDIYEIKDVDNKYFIDKRKNVALKKDIPIKEFNFPNFMTLYIY